MTVLRVFYFMVVMVGFSCLVNFRINSDFNLDLDLDSIINQASEAEVPPQQHQQQHDSDNSNSVLDLNINSNLDSNNSVDAGGGSAFCLLIKDDNGILSEWIAYHYHVFRMRRLIVAVDPLSITSPLENLRPWGDSFELEFTLWSDEDYMPVNFYKTNANLNVSDEYAVFARHRMRQATFVSQCFRRIHDEQQESSNNKHNSNTISWTAHIDTDEFMVPNPWMVSYLQSGAPKKKKRKRDQPLKRKAHAQSDKRKISSLEDTSSGSGLHELLTHIDLMAMLPVSPSEGSLWTFFNQFLSHTSNSGACVLLPRLMFGSREDDGDSNSNATTIAAASSNSNNNSNNTITTWSHNKFESLRWKYHQRSVQLEKSIVDVAQLTQNDVIFQSGTADNVHLPVSKTLYNGKRGCSQTQTNHEFKHTSPIVVYHYLGSLERYMSRSDVRRDPEIHYNHNKHATYDVRKVYGVKQKTKTNPESDSNVESERWWIGGWLDSFVDNHGSEKAYTVLGDLYAAQE